MIRASVEEQSCFYNNCLMFFVTIMKSPIEKLLLIFVLCIISSSYILNVKVKFRVTYLLIEYCKFLQLFYFFETIVYIY